MTAHELAKKLLAGPDLPVRINGWGSDEGMTQDVQCLNYSEGGINLDYFYARIDHRTTAAGFAVVQGDEGYISKKTYGDFIFIVDLNLPTRRSVTNSAEETVKELYRLGPNCRYIYRDSEGRWDELLHDGVTFTGFKPYDGFIPELPSDYDLKK